MPVSLSVIVTSPTWGDLEGCTAALAKQLGPRDELIVVVGEIPTAPAGEAGRQDMRVVETAGWRGRAASLNLGAREARGERLVFLGQPARPAAGWLAALTAAFERGAVIVAGDVGSSATAASLSSLVASWCGPDPTGRNGFLPWSPNVNLAVLRSIFEELRGFDEQLPDQNGMDWCFRAHLAGHRLTQLPDAPVILSTEARVRDIVAAVGAAGRAELAMRARYRRFAFHDAVVRGSRSRLRSELTALPMRVLLRPALLARQGENAPKPAGALASAVLPSMVWVAAAAGMFRAWIDLLLGLRSRPPLVLPPDGDAQSIATPPPTSPGLVVTGANRWLFALVLTALRLADVSAAPVGVDAHAARHWAEPAPWSLAVTRLARRRGWGIEPRLAAVRLERERPATWGEAYLHLLGIEAWLHGRKRFAIALGEDSLDAILPRLGSVPVLTVGTKSVAHPGPALQVTVQDIFRHPRTWPEPIFALLDDESVSAR
ncbi:MAG TPA: hypothetical protein VNG13_12785 [Mycobacteriales bacterium]|nr:hypothetical protein [Mycobacteriales bacterium]